MSLTTFWEYPISQPSKSSNAIRLLSKQLGDAPSPHRIPTMLPKGLEIYWISCHPHANKPSDGFFRQYWMKKQAATQRSFFQWVFKFCELNYFWHKTRGVFFLQLIFECLFFLDATTSLFLLGKRRSPCQEKKEKSGTKLLRRTHVPLREIFLSINLNQIAV